MADEGTGVGAVPRTPGRAGGVMAILLDACAEVDADAPATPFGTHLDEHREWANGHPAPPAALHRAMTFWTRLHGVLSLELAGHFTGMGFDPAPFFAAEVDALAGRVRPGASAPEAARRDVSFRAPGA